MELQKLTPNMMVNDVRESIEFYVKILGFKLNMVVPENSEIIENDLKDGKNYIYAMVSRDEVFIMFMKKDAFEEDLSMFKGSSMGASVSFYIDVDNINEMYTSLKEKVDMAIDLRTTWYGMEEFYIRDCNGYILGFAERK